MNKKATFLDLQYFNELTEENEFFSQYTNEDLPNRYDSNYMLLHYSPTLPEFLVIEDIQKNDQFERNQQHIKIKWPEDLGIFVELLDYLNEENYQLGKEELMIIRPNQLRVDSGNPNLTYEVVEKEQLPAFLSLNYKEDLSEGEEFANLFQEIYHYQFVQPTTTFLLVKLNGQAVASLILHTSDDFLEIDHVLTDRDYRKQGIASNMLGYVMNDFNKNEKPVLLVVDAEDTPKKLYEKIGFQTVSSQISILKVGLDKS